MATLTRSSRRAENLHPHTVKANARLIATSTRTAAAQNIFQNASSGRTKRPLDAATDREYDAVRAKKQKLAVEIISRSVIPIPTHPHPVASGSAVTVNVAPSTLQQPAPAAANPKPAPAKPVLSAPTTIAVQPRERQDPKVAPALTKHQKKVINGIKHELDRLQPSAEDTKHEGRKLRSQEGTRFKSELSAYFPEYDEVIGNEPKEHHVLNHDTPIIVTDANPTNPKSQTKVPLPPIIAALQASSTSHDAGHDVQAFPVRRYSDALFENLSDAQRIDFSFLETRDSGKPLEDPLPDTYFEPSHKKAERLEKSIRNTERGRAQHEKDQIIRLLEGLEGHDWLRIMGVSGITESKKKSFEPARKHFVKGCQAILEKFRQWSLEEKRRKQERERATSQPSADEDEDVEMQDAHEVLEIEDSEAEDSVVVDTDAKSTPESGRSASDGEPQDLSDVDASIAKQLQEEALARSRIASRAKTTVETKVKGPTRSQKPRAPAKSKSPAPLPEPTEFKSFFRKQHEREAAVSRNRRTTRKVLAWGQPIPEIPEADFDLPQQYRDDSATKTRERTKRRDNRRSRRP